MEEHFYEEDEILWLNKDDDDDDDDDENKTYPFQYMSSFCILYLLLNKPDLFAINY